MTDLLPCPGCGSESLVFEATRAFSDKPLFVKCKVCGCKGARGEFIVQAAEKWNDMCRRKME